MKKTFMEWVNYEKPNTKSDVLLVEGRPFATLIESKAENIWYDPHLMTVFVHTSQGFKPCTYTNRDMLIDKGAIPPIEKYSDFNYWEKERIKKENNGNI